VQNQLELYEEVGNVPNSWLQKLYMLSFPQQRFVSIVEIPEDASSRRPMKKRVKGVKKNKVRWGSLSPANELELALKDNHHRRQSSFDGAASKALECAGSVELKRCLQSIKIINESPEYADDADAMELKNQLAIRLQKLIKEMDHNELQMERYQVTLASELLADRQGKPSPSYDQIEQAAQYDRVADRVATRKRTAEQLRARDGKWVPSSTKDVTTMPTPSPKKDSGSHIQGEWRITSEAWRAGAPQEETWLEWVLPPAVALVSAVAMFAWLRARERALEKLI